MNNIDIYKNIKNIKYAFYVNKISNLDLSNLKYRDDFLKLRNEQKILLGNLQNLIGSLINNINNIDIVEEMICNEGFDHIK